MSKKDEIKRKRKLLEELKSTKKVEVKKKKVKLSMDDFNRLASTEV